MFKFSTAGSGSNLSDAELVKLFSQGTDGAFTVLTNRYIGLIRSITLRYKVSGLEPDDLTQEGLMGLLCAAKTFKSDGGASFKNYAALCIKRRLISLYKRSGSSRSKALNDYISLTDESCLELPGSVDPEDTIIGNESLQALNSVVNEQLSEKEQRVLRLYLAGESYGEISTALGMSRKAVDNAMQRIRKKLRNYISSISL